jgi:hypothetical protein
VLDFPSALARLLRDGTLREAFALDPVTALGNFPLEDGDRAALLGLAPEDLELQAGVLLHKRFEEVRRILAFTCTNLGDAAWPLFQKYARYYWPDGESDAWADANVFGERLFVECGNAFLPAERNRTRFAASRRRLGISFVWKFPVRGRFRPAIQIFWRSRSRHWREFAIYPDL